MTANIPEIVKFSEMRREWWIAYRWEDITTNADKEPVYLRSINRDIDDAKRAAENFDIMAAAVKAA